MFIWITTLANDQFLINKQVQKHHDFIYIENKLIFGNFT